MDDMSFQSFLSFAGLSAILSLAMFGCASSDEVEAGPAADAGADVSVEAGEPDASDAAVGDASDEAVDAADEADAAAE